MPVQVLLADVKPSLPQLASKLAVLEVGGGELEFVVSFDALMRIHAGMGQTAWKRWDQREGVLDVKLTGASEEFGLNSTTVRRWLATARLVMKAARKDKTRRVKDASFVAYLVRRPRGPTFKSTGGRVHSGSYAFLAYDVEALVGWDAKRAAPKPFLALGDQVVTGDRPEYETPSVEQLTPPRKHGQVDRWELLRSTKAEEGWVSIYDFVDLFKLKGTGEMKYAVKRALKKIKEAGCDVEDAEPEGRGRPPKRARVCDLQKVYKKLKL